MTGQAWGQAGTSVCGSQSGSGGSQAVCRHDYGWTGDQDSSNIAWSFQPPPELSWRRAPGPMGMGGSPRWGWSGTWRHISAVAPLTLFSPTTSINSALAYHPSNILPILTLRQVFWWTRRFISLTLILSHSCCLTALLPLSSLKILNS